MSNVQRRNLRLISCLHFGRHQTDLLDLRALGDIDRLRHGLILQIRVALHKDHALGAGLENRFQARARAFARRCLRY